MEIKVGIAEDVVNQVYLITIKLLFTLTCNKQCNNTFNSIRQMVPFKFKSIITEGTKNRVLNRYLLAPTRTEKGVRDKNDVSLHA